MNRSATCVVERGEVEEPSVGVPGPAGDRTIDDGGPEEGKHQAGKNPTTLEGTANNNLHGARAEEQLIETEDDFGNVGVTGRWCHKDVPHAKVGHVTDEGRCGSGVGQSVSPEHPLEGCDCDDHDRLEKQGKRALSSSEAAIKETNARNDQPDEESADDQVYVVVLDTSVLCINVPIERVSTLGVSWVKLRLVVVSISR